MIYWLLAWLRRARPYATPVLIAMALSGLLIWIATWRVEWGSSDFPSWLEALSTLAAFGAAGVAVYFAIQTQRLETKREQRIEQSLVRDQASRVAAWFDYVAIETMTDVRGGGALATSIRGAMMGRSRVAGVYLRNASDLPVSSLQVALVDGSRIVSIQSVGVLPPDTEPRFTRLQSSAVEAIQDAWAEEHAEEDHWRPTVGITFVDGAGQGWVRGPLGDLAPVHAETIHDPSHGELWSRVGLH